MEKKESKFLFGRNQEYEAIGEGGLGSGGFGVAMQIRRITDGKIFAAKVTKDPRGVAEAMKEAKSLKALDHENIVRYIDDFPYDVGFFHLHILVMEFCEGKLSLLKVL